MSDAEIMEGLVKGIEAGEFEVFVPSAAEKFAAGLQAIVEPASRETYALLWADGKQWVEFSADKPGRRFTRIVESHGGSRHVHAFVENATGAVYKAEGWKKPAAGVRFASVEAALEAVAKQPAHAGGMYLYR